ncbi:hypothetical protein FGO68_gene14246 [Halteria grandinella]|uniref:Uncharacterized protein n=1 Tax=Halteria grandinella TaxID=5974 RepID=A0A8J8T6U8_HALGN|nr:hypothetical protein FGO68_gene14246 [Halteria grandinella]
MSLPNSVDFISGRGSEQSAEAFVGVLKNLSPCKPPVCGDAVGEQEVVTLNCPAISVSSFYSLVLSKLSCCII